MLADPRLVVLIHGKPYPWSVAGPYFVAQVAFGQQLQSSTMQAMLAAAQHPDAVQSQLVPVQQVGATQA